jgi:hypothetical protein
MSAAMAGVDSNWANMARRILAGTITRRARLRMGARQATISLSTAGVLQPRSRRPVGIAIVRVAREGRSNLSSYGQIRQPALHEWIGLFGKAAAAVPETDL